ncbi:MAG TPA: hypothetical protein VEI82_11585 [Myxococcota bacterium]|nr:hypothetical protein [Myxococcota bacterium]
MLAPSRALLLLLAVAAVLGACSGSSSTHVVVAVNNSVDGQKPDPNLIVAVSVKDDPPPTSSTPALSGARLEAAVQGPAPGTPPEELAYLSLAADGSARGIAVAGLDGSAEPTPPLTLADPADLTWSFAGTRLFAVGSDGLYSSAQAAPLIGLAGAAALDGGPALELDSGTTLEVIAAIGRGEGGLEDLFAVYVDSTGRALGLENLTRTPRVRELDAAWLPDGRRLAVLTRAERDTLRVRAIDFGAPTDAAAALPVHAELAPDGLLLREAEPGSLRDVGAARTRDLLAVSEWTGSDWDVLCLDAHGNAVDLGRAGVDEIAPSWSGDDRRLALEQRCAAQGCGAPSIRILELEYAEGAQRCPRVASARSLLAAGALPAWRP